MNERYIGVRLSGDMLARLKRYSRLRGKSVSEIVRRGLEYALLVVEDEERRMREQ